MVAAWRQRVHVAQGFPKSNTDTAPTAVFLSLFFLSALSHAFIFIRNKKRGHLFVFNGLCIGFCMARVVTCCLRLGWTYDIENRGLGISATIFVAAGVLLLFIVNLVFAQRILRGLHPNIGWQKALSRCFLVLYLLIPALLAMVVTATTQLFFTTNRNIVRIDINIQRAASSYFLFVSLLPVPITAFALLYPQTSEPDHFGKGAFWLKSAVVISASLILSLGAAFRTATAFYDWKPEYNTNPPWYNAKWCFYFFNFTLELVVVLMYLVLRIDLLFHIPNGSKGPGGYSRYSKESTGNEDVETRGLQRRSTDIMSQDSRVPGSPVNMSAVEKEGP